MKRGMIFLLSLLGAGMGTVSLFGYTQNYELALWIFIALISPVIIARTTTYKLFLHGLYCGLGMGILNSGIQFLFFSTYLANNSALFENFKSENIRVFILGIGIIAGLVYGIILGGLAVAASKFHQPK